MYYELYVDVLFLTNFMMDYILLLLVRRMLKCSATHGYICIGATIGAFLSCVVVIIPMPYVVRILISYLIINTFMLVTGLKIRKIRTLVKAVILLYIGAFLLGGMLGYVRQYARIGGFILVLSILFYYIILWMWKFISYLQRHSSTIYKGTLFYQGKVCEVRCLYDTGNHLVDPVTGNDVSVVDKKVAIRLFGEGMPEKIRYISYHSVGKAEGVMPLFQIEKMRICGKEEYEVKKPWIAVSEEQISKANEYQMILNPNLF